MSAAIFVGGSRHASVHLQPDPAGDAPAVLETRPPHIDNLATGERYNLMSMRFTIPHPTTPASVPATVYEIGAYIYAEITDPNVAMAGLQDAALRQWFITQGVLVSDAAHGPGNGKPDAVGRVYLALCAECADMTVPFGSMTDRANWMRQHIEATGHKPTWSNVTPTPDVTATPTPERQDDGSPRVSDV